MACLGTSLVLLFAVAAVPAVNAQALPPVAKDSWLIDCGANATVTSPDGLIFEGDGPYIHTGVSREVPAATINKLSVMHTTLRAFPPARWKKNCYRIPVPPGMKVLVRTRHYYGNYDGLNSPPKFTVRFDTSEWCDMTTSSDLKTSPSCEVVYVTTKKQGTNICLVRTQPGQNPFVSIILVRRLHPSMYGLLDFSTHALFMKQRLAFGANKTIGYPDDAYNRYWFPNDLQGIEGGVSKAGIAKRVSMTAVNTSKTKDAPPVLLFDAAVVATMLDNRTKSNLTIRIPWLVSNPVNIYFTLYYAEVASENDFSAQSQNRTFQVFMDGKLLTPTVLLKPEVEIANEFSFMYNATNMTTIDLVPAQGSTLPPAISGMEVLVVNDVANATSSNDVEVLSMLQSKFIVLQNWTGDPCQPPGYNWEWVGCNYLDASSPRINQLLLKGYELSGDIPDFSSLDALQLIDLSKNNFIGAVPEFLASFPDPLTLDLSHNDFDSLPSALCRKKNLILVTTGNPKIAVAGVCSSGLSGTTPTSASAVASSKVRSFNLARFIISLATFAVL